VTNSSPAAVHSALTRYRVMAWVVGILLATLVFVTLPIKYIWGVFEGPIAIAWTAHGWLFIIYIATVLDLALRQRWHPVKIIVTVLGGVVPFLSFYMEHRVTRETRAQLAGRAPASGSGTGSDAGPDAATQP
jgi:integral membrane protein